MKRTHQIRVGEKWHQYAKQLALSTNRSITNITEEALSMHSGTYQIEKEENEALLRGLFVVHRNHASGQMTPKTPSPAELSTLIKEISKATKTGELWTSKKYSGDNVRKMFGS